MPFSVRDAIRSGEETGADLASGAAWSALLESLQRAAAVVLSDRVPQNPVDTAAGFRHLLVLLHIAIEEIVRSGGTFDIKPANTDNAIKWGMDCPDCAYSGCAIRGDETYCITGNRGSGALRRPASKRRHVLDREPLARRDRDRGERRFHADLVGRPTE